MPSEFDRLVAELQIDDMMEELSPAQRDGFMKAVSLTAYGVQPNQRRIMEAAFAKAQAMPLLGDKADDTDINAAAREGQLRSDADADALDGKRQKKKVTPAAMAKARASAAISSAQLAADAKRMAVEVQRNHAAIGNLHRQTVREGTRERTREILAKALAAFHAGRLTAHQVSVVEARAHRVMDTVAGMERGR